jgi:hypothetical protein
MGKYINNEPYNSYHPNIRLPEYQGLVNN